MHIGFNSMEANFIVAIFTGFTGAILFLVFSEISEGKSFKEFMGDFVFSFIVCFIIGFIVAFVARG